MRWAASLLFLLMLVSSACGSDDEAVDAPIQPTSTTTEAPSTTSTAPTATTTSPSSSTIGTPASCPTRETSEPDAVWHRFVAAFNEADMAALECLVAAEIEWTWDTALLAIHRKAQGRIEALSGFEDLISKGVTFDTQVLAVEGNTVTAETVFNEPALVQMLAGQALLQTDLVTIEDGLIHTWRSTADTTVAVES